MQAADGKLYYRVADGGKYRAQGLVHEGDVVELPAKFRASLVKYLAHAAAGNIVSFRQG